MKIQLMNIQRQHEMHAEEYEQAALNVLRSGERGRIKKSNSTILRI